MTPIPTIPGFEFQFSRNFKKNPIECITPLFKKYGNIFQKKFEGDQHYFLCDPKQAEQVLNTYQNDYRKHPYFSAFEPFFGQHNPFTTNDMDTWEADQNLANPAFDTAIHFNEYTTTITNKMIALSNAWQKRIRKGTCEVSIDQEGDQLILSILKDTLFYDIHLSPTLSQEIPHILSLIQAKTSSWFQFLWELPTKKSRAYRDAIGYMDKQAESIVKTRIDTRKDYDDLLGEFLHAYPAKPSAGCPFATHVSDLTKGYLQKGFISTKLALSWILYELAKRPEIQEQIATEVVKVCLSSNPTYADYQVFKYTHAFINEVLRLHPPLSMILRQAEKQHEMGGYVIPAKACCILPTFIYHRHPDYWDSPDEFRLERFLAKPWGQDYQFAYIPLGAGKRYCIGKNFVLLLLGLVVAKLSRNFKLSLPKDYQPKVIYPLPFFQGIELPKLILEER